MTSISKQQWAQEWGREMFEEWARGADVLRETCAAGRYTSEVTRLTWEAFQAGLQLGVGTLTPGAAPVAE